MKIKRDLRDLLFLFLFYKRVVVKPKISINTILLSLKLLDSWSSSTILIDFITAGGNIFSPYKRIIKLNAFKEINRCYELIIFIFGKIKINLNKNNSTKLSKNCVSVPATPFPQFTSIIKHFLNSSKFGQTSG